jgi:glucokinase
MLPSHSGFVAAAHPCEAAAEKHRARTIIFDPALPLSPGRSAGGNPLSALIRAAYDGFVTMTSYCIGIDLGGTNLRIAAVTPAGERLDLISLPTRLAAGPQAVLDDMATSIAQIVERQSGELLGIGVGSPGPLELPRGVLHHPPNLPGFDGLNLRAELERRVHRPVQVNSDANLAAYGEFMLGAGKSFSVDSLLALTLGTGVGCGIILDRKIWQGMQGAAGESGHGPIDPNGPRCPCGAKGCLEMYASATAIVRRAHELGMAEGTDNGAAGPLTSSAIAGMAEAGDPRALKIFDEVGWALGLSLANLINALDLPLYVLCGGVVAAWPLFAPRMFAVVKEMSYVYRMSMPADPSVFEAGKTHICAAQITDPGILGAAMLPVGAVAVEAA